MGEYKKVDHHHILFCWYLAQTAPATHAARAILTAIFMAKDRRAPIVAQHNSTIGVWAGKDRKEVKKGMKALIDAGILELRGEVAVGRGMANAYEIVDLTGNIPRWEEIKRGERTPPIWKNLSKGDNLKLKGGVNDVKRGDKCTKKGGTLPPQIYNNIKIKESEGDNGGPSRAEAGGHTEIVNQDLTKAERKQRADEIIRLAGYGYAKRKATA